MISMPTTKQSRSDMVTKEECEAILSIGPSLEVERLARAHIALLGREAALLRTIAALSDTDDVKGGCERDALLADNANLKREKERLEKRVDALESEMNPQDVCDVDAGLREREAIAAMQGKSAALDSVEAVGDDFTGWVIGNNYKQRGKLTKSTGAVHNEPWYITADGKLWSAFDVNFRPDTLVPGEGLPTDTRDKEGRE